MQTNETGEAQGTAWVERVVTHARETGGPLAPGSINRAQRDLIDRLHVEAIEMELGRALRAKRQGVVAPQLHAGSLSLNARAHHEAGAAEALRRVRAALEDRGCPHSITLSNVARDMGVTL
jgi:hypothetical protein